MKQTLILAKLLLTLIQYFLINLFITLNETQEQGWKYSYRFYVDGVRIISKNLKQLLIKNGFDKNPIYDMIIYDSNKALFLLFTTQKTDGSKIPPLTPVDCCASYIREEFDDWDKVLESENEPKKEQKKGMEISQN